MDRGKFSVLLKSLRLFLSEELRRIATGEIRIATWQLLAVSTNSDGGSVKKIGYIGLGIAGFSMSSRLRKERI